MSVTIIGAGNLGSNLAKAFYNKNEKIVQIISKSITSAKETAQIVKADFATNLDELKPADFYILCVPDDKIEQVASHKNLKDKTILHTSGAVDIAILSKNTSNYGAYYPLQTFKKGIFPNFAEIPICIEGSNYELRKKLELLAMKICDNIYIMDSKNRLYTHLAAVMSNNFINHLMYLTSNLLEEKKIPKEILFTILKTTFENFDNEDLHAIQTGPARRNDTKTIEKHLELLNNHDNIKTLYKAISSSISDTYKA